MNFGIPSEAVRDRELAGLHTHQSGQIGAHKGNEPGGASTSTSSSSITITHSSARWNGIERDVQRAKSSQSAKKWNTCLCAGEGYTGNKAISEIFELALSQLI